MSTIDDLERAYYLSALGVSGVGQSLDDLRYAFYSNPAAAVPKVTTDAAGLKVSVWDSVNNRNQLIFGDTGLRDLMGVFGGVGFGNSNYVTLRRQGCRVSFNVTFVTTAAWVSGSSIFTLPIGFRPLNVGGGGLYLNSGYTNMFWCNGTDVFSYYTSGVVGTNRVELFWDTNDDWPSVLPGVAIGTIPYQ